MITGYTRNAKRRRRDFSSTLEGTTQDKKKGRKKPNRTNQRKGKENEDQLGPSRMKSDHRKKKKKKNTK